MFSSTFKKDGISRKQRKAEGKLLKRKRIEDSGGIRPRQVKKPADIEKGKAKCGSIESKREKHQGGYRFGRVMERVPCRNKPRFSTLSIAIPGSIVSNCQTKELKTHLVGQIARAASIYHVDEIIVFDDKLSKRKSDYHHYSLKHTNHKRDEEQTTKSNGTEDQNYSNDRKPFDPQLFMARVLQYCECPQYMRRHFFPMHSDLHFAGLLSPLDAPHHVRAEDRSLYREGLVMPKTSKQKNSLVNCGIRNRPVEIDRVLKPGIRCTVKIDAKAYGSALPLKGVVVSPSTPRETNGTYWGYTTRLAGCLSDVFENCPFTEDGYDLKIGTSERGNSSVDDLHSCFPKSFRHALIVFGGVEGIEECVDADEKYKISGSQSEKLFDLWVNVCPFQGSRTIRTEEAVLISLSCFCPHLTAAARDTKELGNNTYVQDDIKKGKVLHFSDDEFSDESNV